MSQTNPAPGIHGTTTVCLVGACGAMLGFTLSCTGFSDYTEVHRMFTFADLRLVMVFAGAVCLSAALFFLFDRPRFFAPRLKPHRGTIIGGVVFGAGWAITGACPAISLVQIGEGQLPAFATLLGVLIGNRIFRWANPRFMCVPSDGC